MLLKNKSRYVAYGGVSAALSLIFLMMASSIPFCRLAFVFAASLAVGIVTVAYDVKLAVVQYVAVSVLAILFLPAKQIAVLYAVVVGNYPIIKLYIDRLKNTPLRIGLKCVLYNAYMGLCCVIAVKVLKMSMQTPYPFWMLWVWMLLAFYVYDYVYSLFMMRVIRTNIIRRG